MYRRRFFLPWRPRWFGPRFGFRGFGCGMVALVLFACMFGGLFLTVLARRF